MPFLRRFAPAAVRRGRRRSAADVQRVLHPGGALVLHDIDGAFVFALRAALAMGLVAVPVVLARRPDLAVYAMLGSFTSTFGRNLPYARRARVLVLVALAMTACVACGSALAAWARPEESAAGAAVVVAATALVAGVAKYVCDATRLSGLGAVMVLFSFAVAAHASPAPADILPYTAMAAAGAAPAWILGMLGLLIHPDRPQRLAVATALRRVAALLEARAAGTEVPGRTRHRATVAVLDAYRSLGQPPPARRTVPRHDTLLLRSADRSWALLVGAARWAPGEQRSAALHLRGQARLLTGRRHGIPPVPGTPGQPVRPQGRQDPSLGEEEPCRAVLTPTYASWANPIEAHFGHCGSSRSPTPTTATTACKPGPCTPTCAGETPTAATPTSSRRSVANVPASEARRASAGADVPCRRNLNDLTKSMWSRPERAAEHRTDESLAHTA